MSRGRLFFLSEEIERAYDELRLDLQYHTVAVSWLRICTHPSMGVGVRLAGQFQAKWKRVS